MFEVPELLEHDRFRLRPITVDDLAEDYDTVMSLDETRLLGCVYVDPPETAGYDAEVSLWVGILYRWGRVSRGRGGYVGGMSLKSDRPREPAQPSVVAAAG